MTERELRALLSANLKRYRGYRKWSQAEFAEKLNISIPFLSDVENGRKWVSPATLVKFADVLGIEPYELFLPLKTLSPQETLAFYRLRDDLTFIFLDGLKHMEKFYIKSEDDSEDDSKEKLIKGSPE